MAHKKGEGSTSNGRDSISKRLGVKLFGGQLATAGSIIIRQRGTKYHPGENTYLGKDYTVHATVAGTVAFRKRRHNRTFVSIIPFDVPETVAPIKPPKKKTAPEETVKVSIAAVVEAAPAPVVEEKQPEPVVTKAAVEAPVEAVVEEVAAPVEEAIEAVAEEVAAPVKSSKDDLKKIEGVGPKIEGLLNDEGIFTFAELSETEPDKIREILEAAGPRYKMHDPATWPEQAKMAAEGKWDELQKWQDELDGGREKE